MAVLEWTLRHEHTAAEWEECMRALSALVEHGLPAIVADRAAQPLPSGWRGWLARQQRDRFVEMNTPAAQWGLEGQGWDSVRVMLLPGPRAAPDRAAALEDAVRATRLPHAGRMEVAERLHAFAWLGLLLWARQRWPDRWALATNLPPSDVEAVRIWAAETLQNHGFSQMVLDVAKN